MNWITSDMREKWILVILREKPGYYNREILDRMSDIGIQDIVLNLRAS